jgi:transketolase
MPEKIEEYKNQALQARLKTLEMIYKAQTSHIGSNFSAIDILTVLFNLADISADRQEKGKDKIVISKGWIAASFYYFLAQKGIIPKEDLETYCMPGSKYIGLLEPNVQGVEAAGGSMGFGLPFGVGFAMAKKVKKDSGRIFVLMGDGEMDEGTTWESALIANHHKLGNLTVVIDANGLQGMGKTEDVLSIAPLKEKWLAFGWNVLEVDGHDFLQIENAVLSAKGDKPLVIIAKTTKGKGVSFMENNNIYHYKELSEKEYKDALTELNG